jgi:hypothetical protein
MNGRVSPLALLLMSCSLACSSCRDEKAASESIVEARDSHEGAVREFLSAPAKFREMVATIRDEASYDRAAPGLADVVRKFRDSAAAFRRLTPPGESEQAKYRQMIADGFVASEPTPEDMLSLMSIKSREKDISQWMVEFMAAGQEAGSEAMRLYGKPEYPDAAQEKPAQLDLGKGEPVPLPSPPPRQVDQAGGASNPLLQHLGREAADDER